MDASEPKCVNPVLNNIGLSHLGSEASIYKEITGIFNFKLNKTQEVQGL